MTVAPQATKVNRLRRFEHLQHGWNDRYQLPAVRLLPGDFYATGKDELITTFLGSCIAACIRNPRTGIGGMNHFMLPAPASPDGGEWGSVASRATRYGSAAMEQLINEILKAGGRRNDLEIKVFGGGRVLTKMTDIGRRNIEFAETFLATEGLKILARDVGETCAREVHYFPATGLARVRHLKPTNQELVVARERAYKKRLATKPVTGEVEFF